MPHPFIGKKVSPKVLAHSPILRFNDFLKSHFISGCPFSESLIHSLGTKNMHMDQSQQAQSLEFVHKQNQAATQRPQNDHLS